MSFPTMADYNVFVDLLSSEFTAFAERLNIFMLYTEPYALTCHRKKLFFFLYVETSMVFAFFYEVRRAKRFAWVYLILKYIALTTPISMLPREWVYPAWVNIFGTALVDMILVNFSITCIAMGNEKGRRIWMRVTPKRRMLETIAMAVYNSVKIGLLTDELCKEHFLEYEVWTAYDPHELYRDSSPKTFAEFMERVRAFRRVRLFDYNDKQQVAALYSYHKGDNSALLHGSETSDLSDALYSYAWNSFDSLCDRVFGTVWPDFADFRNLAELDSVSNLRYGILFILALSSLTVYSIILAGWSSNSKYAFLGALRSAAQMISYEVSISLALLPVILLSGSLNLTEIVLSQANTIWYIFPLLPIALIFLVSMLAETNRTPFDLPEAEAELVAGYNVDYSSLPFAMFFLGEYANMILISVFFCILFLGGWEFMGLTVAAPYILALKATVPWVFFVLVRATLPRYRYDQLMDIGWKAFLPVTGAFLVLVIGLVIFLDVAPVVEELPL